MLRPLTLSPPKALHENEGEIVSRQNCRKTPKAATGMIDCEGSVLCWAIFFSEVAPQSRGKRLRTLSIAATHLTIVRQFDDKMSQNPTRFRVTISLRSPVWRRPATEPQKIKGEKSAEVEGVEVARPAESRKRNEWNRIPRENTGAGPNIA